MQLESYYISGADKVNIAKNATLSLADEPLASGAENNNHLFWGVKNLTIQAVSYTHLAPQIYNKALPAF